MYHYIYTSYTIIIIKMPTWMVLIHLFILLRVPIYVVWIVHVWHYIKAPMIPGQRQSPILMATAYKGVGHWPGIEWRNSLRKPWACGLTTLEVLNGYGVVSHTSSWFHVGDGRIIMYCYRSQQNCFNNSTIIFNC